MIGEDFESTIYSNNNFTIIGKSLWVVTQYERTFKSFLKYAVMKYPKIYSIIFPNQEIPKELFSYSDIESNSNILLGVFNEIDKFPFAELIKCFFNKLLDNYFPSLRKIFIDSKNSRNTIVHGLCNFSLKELENEDSCWNCRREELNEKLPDIISCTLIMDEIISKANKEYIHCNIEKETDRIMNWVMEVEEL